MAREILTSKSSMLQFDGESEEDESPDARGQSSKVVAQPRKQVKDISKLFTNGDAPISFFILERGMAKHIIASLREQIEGCGGLVEPKRPIEGYVLVDTRTENGAGYISAHSTPTRRVVSHTFVEESITRGRLVPYSDLTLFIKQDKPVMFHLHESLGRDEIERLEHVIMLGGGNPIASIGEAQVLIHAGNWSDKPLVAQKYKGVVLFETPKWLDACIACKRFALGDKVGNPSKEPRGLPGRKPGAPRNEFTEEDDRYLIAWMAHYFRTIIADQSSNKPYQTLVEDPRHTHWAYRHTWQSWRERYKTKKLHLDPLIAGHVARHPRRAKAKESSPETIVFDSEGPETEEDGPPHDPITRSKRKAQAVSDASDRPSGSKTTKATAKAKAQAKEIRPKKKARTSRPVPSEDEEEEDMQIKVSVSQLPQHPPTSPQGSPLNASTPPTKNAFREPDRERSSSPPENLVDVEGSQDGSSQSAPSFHILEPVVSIVGPGALDRQKAEIAAVGQYSQAEVEEEGSYEDPDVDVEGVTQAGPQSTSHDVQDGEGGEETPDDTGGTEIESVSVQLLQIADQFTAEVDDVRKAYQGAVTELNEKEALDLVRQKFKALAPSKKVKGKGKGRAS